MGTTRAQRAVPAGRARADVSCLRHGTSRPGPCRARPTYQIYPKPVLSLSPQCLRVCRCRWLFAANSSIQIPKKIRSNVFLSLSQISNQILDRRCWSLSSPHDLPSPPPPRRSGLPPSQIHPPNSQTKKVPVYFIFWGNLCSISLAYSKFLHVWN